MQGCTYGTCSVVKLPRKDLYQTYGNKPYPIAVMEDAKQIEKTDDVMREILTKSPVLQKQRSPKKGVAMMPGQEPVIVSTRTLLAF